MDRRSILLAFGASLLAGTAKAQDLPVIGDFFGVDAGVFRQKDLMGGTYATATSKIALRRSRAPAIRQFAHWEIAEQAKVAEALDAVPGSAPVRPDQADLIAALERTDGRSFDAQYVVGQLMGHQELYALNTSYLQSGTDPTSHGVAEMSLPIIQRHLAILQTLHQTA